MAEAFYKTYEVDRLTLEVKVYSKITNSTPPRLLHARPLRTTPIRSLGIIYNQRVYPLSVDAEGHETILTNQESFETTSCQIPKKGDVYELPFATKPKNAAIDIEDWRIELNNFGMYVFVKAQDTVIEQLVTLILVETTLRVLSWGAVDSTTTEFSEWKIAFPVGLNVNAVAAILIKVIEKIEPSDSLQQDPTLDQQELNEAKKKIEQLETATDELENLRSELIDAYEKMEQLRVMLTSHQSTQDSVQRLRKTDAEKVFANFLQSAYPKLAFPPDTPKILIQKFTGSKNIWSELTLLSTDNHKHNFVALHGPAGKAGWYELPVHISTGKDSRGRVYLKKSKREHLYDVVVHWKKDKSDQNRVLIRLANYSPFENPYSVEG